MTVTELRQDLAAAYRLAAHYGWDDVIFSHISARIDETQFLMIPFGMMFGEVTADDLLVCDTRVRYATEDARYNPAALLVHGTVLAARPDVGCVVHLHTVDGAAVSAMRCGLMPITQAAMLAGRVQHHAYKGLETEWEESQRLQDDLGGADCLIMENHGTLAVGATVGDAFMRAYTLERACSMQVRAMHGGDVRLIPEEGQDQVSRQLRQQATGAGNGVNLLAWKALRRLADRLDRGYLGTGSHATPTATERLVPFSG